MTHDKRLKPALALAAAVAIGAAVFGLRASVADNAVQVAQANLRSAEAQAAITQRALNDAQVRAPFAGIVAKRFVNVGDKLSPDMPVALIVDLAKMEMEAPIPVGEIPYVKVGQ